VDSKHKTGELKLDDVFPSGDCPLVAELVPRELEQFAQENAQTASQLLDQAEQFREQFNGGSFKVDEKRMEELQRQMKDFQKNFKTEELKTDPKAMEELKRQMEQFRKNFHEEQLWGAPE
jgi:predicted RNase H-like nuclease (RuvC/YqgF family)